MPIDNMGRFVPATANMAVAQPRTQLAANQANFAVQPTAAAAQSPASLAQRNMTMSQPMMQNQMVARNYASPLQASMRVNPAIYGMFNTGTQDGVSQPAPPPQNPMEVRPGMGPQQAVQAVQGPAGVQTQQRAAFGRGAPVYPAPPPQPGPSVEQQVQNNNPQSVQNFMNALHQVGAGSNNAMMNPSAQLGAPAQAGFRGFGYQPGYGPQYVNTGYAGRVNDGGLSYQGNQAYTNANYNAANRAAQGYYGQAAAPQLANTGGISTVNGPGLLGGAQNAPQFQTPAPWGQPRNAQPGTPGSNWADTSQGWEDYFYGRGVSGAAPGSFYSTAAPGENIGTNPDGSYDTNSPKAVSDITAKENILPAADDLQEFLDALGVYSYEYKNKEHGEGRYISPMAQEFEKSKLGKQAVEQTDEGLKMVNYGRLAGVQTAALALLNHKYNELEARFETAMKDRIKSKRGK